MGRSEVAHMAAEKLTSSSVVQVFFCGVTFEVLIVLGFQLGSMLDKNASDSDYLYGGIMVTTLVFLELFALDAIFNENFIQVVAFFGFTLIVLAYTIIRLAKGGTTAELVVQLVIVILGEFFYVFVVHQLFRKFGFRIFRKIGKDARLRRMYRSFQVFVTLLKLDIYCQFMLIIQNVTILLEVNGVEFWANIIAVAYVLGVALLGFTAVRLERKAAVAVFHVLNLVEPVYLVYRLVVLFSAEDRLDGLPLLAVIGTAVICIFARIALMLACVAAARNFNHGLREAIDNYNALTRKKAHPVELYGKFEDRRMDLTAPFDWQEESDEGVGETHGFSRKSLSYKESFIGVPMECTAIDQPSVASGNGELQDGSSSDSDVVAVGSGDLTSDDDDAAELRMVSVRMEDSF